MKNYTAFAFLFYLVSITPTVCQTMVTNIHSNNSYSITHSFKVDSTSYFVDVSLSGKLKVKSFTSHLQPLETYEMKVSNFNGEDRMDFFDNLAVITYLHKILIIDIYSREVNELDLPYGYSSEFSKIELIDDDNFILYLRDLESNVDVAFIVLKNGNLLPFKLPNYKVLHKFKNYLHVFSSNKGHRIYNLVSDEIETIDKYGSSFNPWLMEETGFWYFDSSGFFNFRHYGSKEVLTFFDVKQLAATRLSQSHENVYIITFGDGLYITCINKETKAISEHTINNIKETNILENSIKVVGSKLVFQSKKNKTYVVDLSNWSFQLYNYDAKILHKNYIIENNLFLINDNKIHQIDLISGSNVELFEMPFNVKSEIEFAALGEIISCYFNTNTNNEKALLSFQETGAIANRNFLPEYHKGIANECKLFINDETLYLADDIDLYRISVGNTKKLNEDPISKIGNDLVKSSQEKLLWWEKKGANNILKALESDHVNILIELHELIGVKSYDSFGEIVLIGSDIDEVLKIKDQEIRSELEIIELKTNKLDNGNFMLVNDMMYYFSNQGIHQVVDFSTTNLIPYGLPSSVSFSNVNSTLYFTERDIYKLGENGPDKIDLDLHFYQKVSIIDQGSNYLFLCIEILKKNQYFIFFEPNNIVQVEELSEEIDYIIHNEILYSVLDFNKLLVYDIKNGIKNIYDLDGDFLEVVEVEGINQHLTGLIIRSVDKISYHTFTIDQTLEKIIDLSHFNHTGIYKNKRLINIPSIGKTLLLANDEVFEIGDDLKPCSFFEDQNVICKDGVVVNQDLLYYFAFYDEKGKQVYKLELDDLTNSNNTIEKTSLKFNLFPNPAAAFLTVENINDVNVDFIKIIDLQGNYIESYSNWRSINIDISHLNDGCYYIQFYDGNEVSTLPFIKISD